MNQFRKIGTVRLSAGFFVCFLVYPNNKYWSISNIFSEHLEFTSKKIILRKNYSRGIWTLCLHPQSYAYGSFVNYTSFLPDWDKTWIFPKDFRKTLKYQISLNSVPRVRLIPCRQTWRSQKSLFAVLRMCLKVAHSSKKLYVSFGM